MEELCGQSANTTDGARLDIAANGYWGGRFERTFVDVRLFNPYTPSNRNTYRRENLLKARDGEREGLRPASRRD